MEKLVNFNIFVSQIETLPKPRFNLEMNKLPPSGIDFVFKISGNFSFLDGLILRYFTFSVAKFLAYIGCSNHFFYTNRQINIHIIDISYLYHYLPFENFRNFRSLVF